MRELPLADLADMNRAEAEYAIRSRVQTTYLGDATVLTRFLGRPKIFLSTRDLGFACHVMLDGYWEIWLTLFFARLLKPGMTVVDVGANFGYYTVLFGDAVGASGRVIAVEPVPTTADLLAKTVELNGHSERTSVIRSALGRADTGHAHIFLPGNEPKNATIVQAARAGTLSVPITNLNVIAAKLDRVDVIKIDAEGSERDIIAGMTDIIVKHKPTVVLEFNAGRYKSASDFLQELRALFNTISVINYDGDVDAISDEQLLSCNDGQDRLLLLEAAK